MHIQPRRKDALRDARLAPVALFSVTEERTQCVGVAASRLPTPAARPFEDQELVDIREPHGRQRTAPLGEPLQKLRCFRPVRPHRKRGAPFLFRHPPRKFVNLVCELQARSRSLLQHAREAQPLLRHVHKEVCRVLARGKVGIRALQLCPSAGSILNLIDSHIAQSSQPQ